MEMVGGMNNDITRLERPGAIGAELAVTTFKNQRHIGPLVPVAVHLVGR
jgi:hypothetical protein